MYFRHTCISNAMTYNMAAAALLSIPNTSRIPIFNFQPNSDLNLTKTQSQLTCKPCPYIFDKVKSRANV